MTCAGQEVVESKEDVLTCISRRYPSARLIAVDGWKGAGKTHLAKFIAGATEHLPVDVDSYLNSPTADYLSDVRTTELSAVLAPKESRKVISGVCILAVLEKIGLVPDLHIYIKHMGHNRLWRDADWINPDSTGLDCINSESEKRFGPSSNRAKLDSIMRKYHLDYVPQDRAEIIFERPD